MPADFTGSKVTAGDPPAAPAEVPLPALLTYVTITSSRVIP